MLRGITRSIGLVATTFLLLCIPAWTCPANEEKPNIVVIFIDDMGFADPSCFGNPMSKTPNIDRLARAGIKLTNFYVTSPICSPSRVAITTGQYHGRWGIHSYLNSRAANKARGMKNYLDASAPTTAKKLKTVGYATGHFGKWHMGGGRDVDDAPLPQAYGFDESLVSFEGLGDRIISNTNALEKAKALGHGTIIACERIDRSRIQVDYTIDFIRRNKDKPFYVRFFPNDVHGAHIPAKGTEDKYKSVSDNPYDWAFLAVLENMDNQIGRIIDEIEHLGLSKRTLIIFTSDNGPSDGAKKYLNGEKPAGFAGIYRGRKWSIYEGGIRMPFIAVWPGKIKAGTQDDTSIMSTLDLSPTICKIAGVEVEENLDGIDRSSVLLGTPSGRLPLFWQYGHPHSVLKGGLVKHLSPTFAMREGDYKFMINPDGSEAQLFNLANDPSESTNLFDQQPTRVASMTQSLGQWAHGIGYAFDRQVKPAKPGPMIAVVAGNQMLNFNNVGGVIGNHKKLTFDGSNFLDLPTFRLPKIAGGRNLQIKGRITPRSNHGVIFAHGDHVNGYAIYMSQGLLCFATCVNGEREVVASTAPITQTVDFEANWNNKGAMLLKINKMLVSKPKTVQLLSVEPTESIQIGGDAGQQVGDYKSSKGFSGIIENLTFKYPIGS
ncbi:MAG TPA: hypothetical protein EYN14_11685 [Alphaproteobacteria bacterium]|nr:hypothetical protein [Alphaproteobacteria bacterium]